MAKNDDNAPMFGVIRSIYYYHNEDKYFLTVTDMQADYHSHYHAYHVVTNSHTSITTPQALAHATCIQHPHILRRAPQSPQICIPQVFCVIFNMMTISNIDLMTIHYTIYTNEWIHCQQLLISGLLLHSDLHTYLHWDKSGIYVCIHMYTTHTKIHIRTKWTYIQEYIQHIYVGTCSGSTLGLVCTALMW